MIRLYRFIRTRRELRKWRKYMAQSNYINYDELGI